ncbi:putative chemotaxis protein methyltransferase CheR [Pseudomonas sp. CFII64]|uniref:CheR family methyltransferase n=1 Tax=Pseudomonas sp. CFII64 TaxID=911242 RepID=UPI0003582506|nr:protein-glutamate O-methyltransferase CheR [Pseudomonas sp. CFII64]EPJ89009.1 putative chemotaxis protein methyltransferase CheR [Pseudomonas sp. CFII64]
MTDPARFFAFLKDRIGLDVASVGEAIIERALRQRCTASASVNYDGYWALLHGSASEQQALIEAVIVPETWFFRYPESFVTLGKLVGERLAALQGVRPMRILSLPCSTGEEPYSIAMALFDAHIGAQQFQIDAMDISPISIARAERGVYGKNSFRGADTAFRERYFSAVEEGFLVDERVRDRVRLRSGNLLDPALLTQTAYDFVFCRNLLIYFDQPTQKQVFEVLKRLTRGDGVLFIGPAEGSLLTRMGMRSIGVPQTFAFSHHVEPPRETSPSQVPLPLANLARSMPGTAVAPPVRMPARAYPRASAPAPTPRPAPVAPIAASGTTDDVATLLATIASLANEGRSVEARAACERFLQQHEPIAQIFYWLGLLSEVEGNAALAQGFYRKALYLQPQHAETLAQLAALLEAQGDRSGARRLQERAARGLTKQGSRQ